MAERVVLGLSASAAAFKGVALASMLRREGLQVDAVMTPRAMEMVAPLQLECVTGRPVCRGLFADVPGDPVPHVRLTEGCSLLVVAPATAHLMARAAAGMADDILTSCLLACEAPVVMAPSMNSRMWRNPATRANRAILAERGVVLAGPVSGRLACGTEGEGRMMEPSEVLEVCLRLLGRGEG